MHICLFLRPLTEAQTSDPTRLGFLARFDNLHETDGNEKYEQLIHDRGDPRPNLRLRRVTEIAKSPPQVNLINV